MLFMIDQDVPRNGTTFTLLHWFQPDLHRTMDNSTLSVIMIDDNTTSIQGAPYIPPTPPGGSGPHRYNFILYAQPPNFTLPSQYASINPPASTADRIGFNLTAFAAAANLQQPIAANYLRVLNGTESETSSAETATGTVGVAPTESPTVIASTTDTEAAASASSAATQTGTAMETTASETGSGTAEASSPAETASSGSGAVGAFGTGGKDLLMGIALAVVGAGMFMA
jgi:phosphatidylethanolamine-binding protein